MRFHDLRASHATIMLDRMVPVHVVAKRIGDDPATLLRWYAKRTKKGRYLRRERHRNIDAGGFVNLGRNWVERARCSRNWPSLRG